MHLSFQMLEWQFAETLDLWCIQKISFQLSPCVPILNMDAKTFKIFTCERGSQRSVVLLRRRLIFLSQKCSQPKADMAVLWSSGTQDPLSCHFAVFNLHFCLCLETACLSPAMTYYSSHSVERRKWRGRDTVLFFKIPLLFQDPS